VGNEQRCTRGAARPENVREAGFGRVDVLSQSGRLDGITRETMVDRFSPKRPFAAARLAVDLPSRNALRGLPALYTALRQLTPVNLC
jgi:hypothetical protein